MIRQARGEDEAQIRACAELAYAPYIALIGRPPAPMLADFASQIAAGEAYVACDAAGAVQGFVVFYAQEGHILLENVAVHPNAARRGIGATLIRYCETSALQRGFAQVQLYTNAKMRGNLLIYPRLGYVEIGRRHEAGFDRVYFEKTLT